MSLHRPPASPDSLARCAHSYLVRIWEEPRESGIGSARMRGYVRDLRTGEETYLDDPAELGDYLGRQLVPAARERSGEARGPGGRNETRPSGTQG